MPFPVKFHTAFVTSYHLYAIPFVPALPRDLRDEVVNSLKVALF